MISVLDWALLGRNALKRNKIVLSFFSVVDGYEREGLAGLPRGSGLSPVIEEKYVLDVVLW